MDQKEKLLHELDTLLKLNDPEGGHISADDALIEYINDPDIEKAYNKISKWYS